MDRERAIDRLAEIIKIISNHVRLKILLILMHHGELHAPAIENHIASKPGSVVNHLLKMKDWGLLSSRRQGFKVYHSISDPHLIIALTRLIASSVKPTPTRPKRSY